MNQKRKIKNLNEFKKYTKSIGYILITNSRQNSIHKSSCSYLNKKNFLRKLTSKSKPGEYIWITNIESMKKELENTRPCSYCKPFKEK